MAGYLRRTYSVSIARACRLAALARSSWYYRSRLDDAEVEAALRDLAARYPRRGFDNYYARLKAAGEPWARSRVLRVYRALGLRHRKPRGRRLPVGERAPMPELTGRDQVWACDFMSDALSDGRTARVVCVIDEFSREGLRVEAALSYPAERLCRVLDEVAEARGGYPQALRTDNGPEFTAAATAAWCERHGVRHVRIRPGRPMENGRVERFNRSVREDVLAAGLHASFSGLNASLAAWRCDYNATHPHTALGGAAPGAFGRERQRGPGSSALGPPPRDPAAATLTFTL